MINQLQTKAAAEILDLIQLNSYDGWMKLYDTYAPMLYGALLQITGDEKTAEIILVEVFSSLKENPQLLMTDKPLYISLLHQASATAKNYLDQNKSSFPAPLDSMFPLTHSLLFHPATLKSVADSNSTTEAAIKEKLQKEVKEIRTKCSPDFKLFAV